MKLAISLDEKEVNILKKRAKKNLLTLKEQVEDIIRRSCVNAIAKTSPKIKSDDKLVDIFSRARRGKRKRKKKTKKK